MAIRPGGLDRAVYGLVPIRVGRVKTDTNGGDFRSLKSDLGL